MTDAIVIVNCQEFDEHAELVPFRGRPEMELVVWHSAVVEMELGEEADVSILGGNRK